MNDQLIRNALSYDLGSDLHEAWRAPRKKEDGSYEPRVKKSKDEAWNIKYQTDEVDIANCTFEQLPSNWQYENLEAARVVINLVYDYVMNNQIITNEIKEQMADTIHVEWLKRNEWVYDANYGNPSLAVPYAQLTQEEKDKDIAQIEPGILKVRAYQQGLVDINTIVNKYGLVEEC